VGYWNRFHRCRYGLENLLCDAKCLCLCRENRPGADNSDTPVLAGVRLNEHPYWPLDLPSGTHHANDFTRLRIGTLNPAGRVT